MSVQEQEQTQQEVPDNTEKPVEKELRIQTQAQRVRCDLNSIEKTTRELLNHSCYRGEQAFPRQHEEMKAHTTLAIRALEDARMRLGKLCQYAHDGVSILDK